MSDRGVNNEIAHHKHDIHNARAPNPEPFDHNLSSTISGAQCYPGPFRVKLARMLSALLITSLSLAQASTPDPDKSSWVTKTHSGTFNGKTVNYESTVGLMPIRNSDGTIEGRMFFTAYRHTDRKTSRPLLFVFNGGPGSASLWLHMGFVGPKRVAMLDTAGMMPPPPYSMVNNEESLLPYADIVCIDPVGTGFSRPEKPELGRKFWGVSEDISSVGQFIRSYMTKEGRWLSPIYLMGESYGTTRAAGLSSWLNQNGIGVNGLMFISTVLNFGVDSGGNGALPTWTTKIPTYTATAWYHKKLPADLQRKPLAQVVEESRKWSRNEYLLALAKGAQLSPAERKKVISDLARYTGLKTQYLEDANMRVSPNQFYIQLLRDNRDTVGRLDTRFTGFNRSWISQGPDFDPSMSAIQPPFTSVTNHYLRNDLGFVTNDTYYVLGEGLGAPWNWGDSRGTTDTSEMLRSAVSQNPYIRALFANGYYDMATPFGAVEYSIDQLALDERLRKNFTWTYYESGHMIYLEDNSRRQLRDDCVKFLSGN